MPTKTKTLSLIAAERDLIRSVDLETLAPIVERLELPSGGDGPRPIRLRLPTELVELLDELSEQLAVPKVRLLVNAAHEYRLQFPPEQDWLEPGSEHGNLEEDLQPRVLRLHEEERELLRNLGRGVKAVPNRREALRLTTEILKTRAGVLAKRKDTKRVSTKLRLPDDLVRAIEKRTAEGHSFSRILIAAAEEAAKRPPEP